MRILSALDLTPCTARSEAEEHANEQPVDVDVAEDHVPLLFNAEPSGSPLLSNAVVKVTMKAVVADFAVEKDEVCYGSYTSTCGYRSTNFHN